MIIVMSHQASKAQVDAVVDRVTEIGLRPEVSVGEDRAVIGVIGGNAYAFREAFSHLPAIHQILQITKPFKLASREFNKNDTVVTVGKVKIGRGAMAMIAGPCAIESAQSNKSPMCASIFAGARVVSPLRNAPNDSGAPRSAFPARYATVATVCRKNSRTGSAGVLIMPSLERF